MNSWADMMINHVGSNNPFMVLYDETIEPPCWLLPNMVNTAWVEDKYPKESFINAFMSSESKYCRNRCCSDVTWWCHQMETFTMLLALCAGNSPVTSELYQPRLWFITGGYLVKRWFIPAAARARGQSNDLNRGILASNLFNCHNEVINAPPIPSISRCIHTVYRHKNVWEYQWSNFIYNCMSTFLHYVRCKDALLDCSAPGGERCESLTWVDEIPHTEASHAELWCFPWSTPE